MAKRRKSVPKDGEAQANVFQPDWWKIEGVARTLAKCFAEHLVALEVAFLVDGKPGYDVYTGFMLRLGSIDLWVTAGHVIDRIRELLANSKVSIVRAGLLDGYDSDDAAAIPVHLESLPLFSAEPDLDFGVAFLREAYVAPIVANPRFRLLTPVVWHNHDKAEPEGYYIVGMPEEWVDVRDVGTRPGKVLRKATMGIACVPVERIEPTTGEEPQEFWHHAGAFYGRLLPIRSDDGTPLESVLGMSGGPVFSIERTKDDQFRYYLYGIQSAWLPSSRIIRATPIAHVADLVHEGMAHASRQLGLLADTEK